MARQWDRIERNVKRLWGRFSQPFRIHSTATPSGRPVTREEVLGWITHARWFVVDQLEKQRAAPSTLQCPLCETHRAIHEFAVRESYCQFGGGRLVRHECPQCGVIFGPAKVMNLTEPELAQEYRLLYDIYSEHDTTDNEVRTFHAMQPRRDGLYLNFGSGGAWNAAIQRLRAEGWNVVGYEPYASGHHPHVIRELSHLKQHKFDGIMSNNVLEHLTNPLDTFRLWQSLLRGPDAVMAHSTPCFEYRYAFTRFHLFFFTGSSPQFICERTGFRSERVASDGDYICYRFVSTGAQLASRDRAA